MSFFEADDNWGDEPQQHAQQEAAGEEVAVDQPQQVDEPEGNNTNDVAVVQEEEPQQVDEQAVDPTPVEHEPVETAVVETEGTTTEVVAAQEEQPEVPTDGQEQQQAEVEVAVASQQAPLKEEKAENAEENDKKRKRDDNEDNAVVVESQKEPEEPAAPSDTRGPAEGEDAAPAPPAGPQDAAQTKREEEFRAFKHEQLVQELMRLQRENLSTKNKLRESVDSMRTKAEKLQAKYMEKQQSLESLQGQLVALATAKEQDDTTIKELTLKLEQKNNEESAASVGIKTEMEAMLMEMERMRREALVRDESLQLQKMEVECLRGEVQGWQSIANNNGAAASRPVDSNSAFVLKYEEPQTATSTAVTNEAKALIEVLKKASAALESATASVDATNEPTVNDFAAKAVECVRTVSTEAAKLAQRNAALEAKAESFAAREAVFDAAMASAAEAKLPLMMRAALDHGTNDAIVGVDVEGAPGGSQQRQLVLLQATLSAAVAKLNGANAPAFTPQQVTPYVLREALNRCEALGNQVQTLQAALQYMRTASAASPSTHNGGVTSSQSFMEVVETLGLLKAKDDAIAEERARRTILDISCKRWCNEAQRCREALFSQEVQNSSARVHSPLVEAQLLLASSQLEAQSALIKQLAGRNEIMQTINADMANLSALVSNGVHGDVINTAVAHLAEKWQSDFAEAAKKNLGATQPVTEFTTCIEALTEKITAHAVQVEAWFETREKTLLHRLKHVAALLEASDRVVADVTGIDLGLGTDGAGPLSGDALMEQLSRITLPTSTGSLTQRDGTSPLPLVAIVPSDTLTSAESQAKAELKKFHDQLSSMQTTYESKIAELNAQLGWFTGQSGVGDATKLKSIMEQLQKVQQEATDFKQQALHAKQSQQLAMRKIQSLTEQLNKGGSGAPAGNTQLQQQLNAQTEKVKELEAQIANHKKELESEKTKVGQQSSDQQHRQDLLNARKQIMLAKEAARVAEVERDQARQDASSALKQAHEFEEKLKSVAATPIPTAMGDGIPTSTLLAPTPAPQLAAVVETEVPAEVEGGEQSSAKPVEEQTEQAEVVTAPPPQELPPVKADEKNDDEVKATEEAVADDEKHADDEVPQPAVVEEAVEETVVEEVAVVQEEKVEEEQPVAEEEPVEEPVAASVEEEDVPQPPETEEQPSTAVQNKEVVADEEGAEDVAACQEKQEAGDAEKSAIVEQTPEQEVASPEAPQQQPARKSMMTWSKPTGSTPTQARPSGGAFGGSFGSGRTSTFAGSHSKPVEKNDEASKPAVVEKSAEEQPPVVPPVANQDAKQPSILGGQQRSTWPGPKPSPFGGNKGGNAQQGRGSFIRGGQGQQQQQQQQAPTAAVFSKKPAAPPTAAPFGTAAATVGTQQQPPRPSGGGNSSWSHPSGGSNNNGNGGILGGQPPKQE